MDKSKLKETLAALAHDQWSGWMDYMFSKCIDYQPGCVQAEDGAVIMPKWAVDRWKKQAKTPYSELTPAEMDSDRTEADKFLVVFNATDSTLIRDLVDMVNELAGYIDFNIESKCSCGQTNRIKESKLEKAKALILRAKQ